MYFLARLITGFQIFFLAGGLVGTLTGNTAEGMDGLRMIPVAIPLLTCAWLAWKALKPVLLSKLTFVFAHLPSIAVIFFRLIPLIAPKKVGGFIAGGLVLAACGALVLWQLHVQRKMARAQSQS